MRVLLAYRVPMSVESVVLSDNVAYRPDLEHKGPRALVAALVHLKPDALVARAPIDRDGIAQWRRALGGGSALIVESQPASHGNRARVRVWRGEARRLVALTEDDADPSELVHRVVPPEDEVELAAFLALERAYRRDAAARARPPRAANGADRAAKTVILVGAGVVNLITAAALVHHGYEPLILERAPDPRAAAPWTEFGCTRGGGNARMFTLTECDNYNEKSWLDGAANTMFRRPISHTGWLVCEPGTLSDDEGRWIEEFETIPPWLAAVYNDDIFGLSRAARAHWDELMAAHPELFEDVGLHPGILRLYSDPDHYEWSVVRQMRTGAFLARLTPRELAEKYPALAEPCESGVFAGGIEVVGFTLNVHDFLARLVGHLEERGVRFEWQREVEAVVVDADRAVTGVSSRGELLTAGHYVISPGAYGNHLLKGFRSAGRIHGVLGVWLTLPNLEPKLTHSLKIARRGHKAEDANVTLGRTRAGEEVLIYGSGYGHTGLDPRNIAPAQLDELFAAVEENARTFFPHCYDAALASGLLSSSQRYCVRPWTASSLGVFEIGPAKSGGVLVITGGHNTGGFAQAPAVAAATLAAMRSAWHPMHELYLPDRAATFLGAGASVASPSAVVSGSHAR